MTGSSDKKIKDVPAYVARAVAKYSLRAWERYSFYAAWRISESRARRLSPDELRARQWQRLVRVMEHAYREIPFYSDRFKEAGLLPADIRTPDDLRKLPLLTKEDIRRNFPDRLVWSRRKLLEWHLGQTSGSTAESMHYVRPQNARYRSPYYSIMLRCGGIAHLPIFLFSTPHCTAATCSLKDGRQGVWIYRIQQFPLLRHLDDTIKLTSADNILRTPDSFHEGLADILCRHSPSIMLADPVYLAAFAHYLRRTGRPVPKFASIITTFELLTGSLKDLFEKVFKCEVYTEYGGSELLDVANECELHNLHIMSDNAYVEVLDGDKPVPPGGIGRLVLTDLGNFNMPFIRYDIGDLAELGPEKCACGRNTWTLKAIHGRVGDAIRLEGPNGGRLVTALQADEAFRGVRGVAFYRLARRTPTEYDIAIMADPVDRDPDVQEIVSRCGRIFGSNCRFNVRTVDEIKPERSMKFRFVRQEG